VFLQKPDKLLVVMAANVPVAATIAATGPE
jgi:hypothetical protein